MTSQRALGFFKVGAMTCLYLLLIFTTISLLVLSFFFEEMGYTLLLEKMNHNFYWGVTLAFSLALAFNLGKVGLIWSIVHRKSQRNYSSLIPSYFLRVIVIGNSLFLTLLIFSDQLVEPNLEQTLVNYRTQTQRRFDDQLVLVNDRFEQRKGSVRRSYGDLRAQSVALYTPRINELNDLLVKEMDNVRGKTWKGSRYREFKDRLSSEKKTLAADLATLAEQEVEAITLVQKDWDRAMEGLHQEHRQAMGELTLARFHGAEEAQNQSLQKLIIILKSVANTDAVTYKRVAILLSIIATLVVEFMPLILLGHVFTQLIAIVEKPVAKRSPHLQVVEGDIQAAE